jgi:hypothetical protein
MTGQKQTRYPSYDVMDQKQEWDDHTQSIVTSRLIREHEYRFLTNEEAEILRAACRLLVDDDRGDVIQYILCHIDETLNSSIGESERKRGIPPGRTLVREGLRAMEQAAQALFGSPYINLEENRQRDMLFKISQSAAEPSEVWISVPQKDLFKKLLTLTIESYCSHPSIWSEIGYGGPAYPRGYVRAQLGQLDPWEAQPER